MTTDAINGLKEYDLPFNGIYVFDWFDEARSGLVFSETCRLALWFSHIATLDAEDDWQHVFMLCQVKYEPFELLDIVDKIVPSPPDCNKLHVQVLLTLLQNDLMLAEGYLTMTPNIRIELGDPKGLAEMTPIEHTLYQAQLQRDIARLQVELKECIDKLG